MIGNRKFDVAVVGGGVAGCAASISAVREGMRVVLIERAVTLGGLATNGLVNWWEPMCDGNGNQLVSGIAEEMLLKAVRYGRDTIPPCWRSGTKEERVLASAGPKGKGRYVSLFSPTLLSLTLLKWLRDEGVEVVLDALLTDVSVRGSRVVSLRFATQSGFERLYARTYIDATGTAELFARGGFPTEEGENGLSYMAHIANTVPFPSRKWYYVGEISPWRNQDKGGFVAGTTRKDVNAIVQNGQLGLYADVAAGKIAGEIVALPAMPQFRTVRRVKGGYTLSGRDANTYFEDSLCVGGDFERKGIWYEIPYRCFYTEQADNVVAAGRIVSAADAAWNAVRVIPIAALTGEVGGLIATLSVRCGAPVYRLGLNELRKALERRRILLHGSEC